MGSQISLLVLGLRRTWDNQKGVRRAWHTSKVLPLPFTYNPRTIGYRKLKFWIQIDNQISLAVFGTQKSVGHSKSQYRVFVLFYSVWVHIWSVWAHTWSIWDHAYSILLHFYSRNVLTRDQISKGVLFILFAIFITCMPHLTHFGPFLVHLDPIITLFLSKIATFWSQKFLIIDIDGFRAF